MTPIPPDAGQTPASEAGFTNAGGSALPTSGTPHPSTTGPAPTGFPEQPVPATDPNAGVSLPAAPVPEEASPFAHLEKMGWSKEEIAAMHGEAPAEPAAQAPPQAAQEPPNQAQPATPDAPPSEDVNAMRRRLESLEAYEPLMKHLYANPDLLAQVGEMIQGGKKEPEPEPLTAPERPRKPRDFDPLTDEGQQYLEALADYQEHYERYLNEKTERANAQVQHQLQQLQEADKTRREAAEAAAAREQAIHQVMTQDGLDRATAERFIRDVTSPDFLNNRAAWLTAWKAMNGLLQTTQAPQPPSAPAYPTYPSQPGPSQPRSLHPGPSYPAASTPYTQPPAWPNTATAYPNQGGGVAPQGEPFLQSQGAPPPSLPTW